MRQFANNKDLQERIEFLENKTKQQQEQLKVHFQEAYQSIKPQTLIKNAFSDAASEPKTRNNMLNSLVGLLTGFITHKLVIGSSPGIFKRLAGTAIQIGISKLVKQKFPAIKQKTQELIQQKNTGTKISLGNN
ncbi:MAG: hypothetical protein H7Y03_13690 [Chitinophagaceae bacterium]|nr:hypothetical protein [Chitinophagaceae bacterium]